MWISKEEGVKLWGHYIKYFKVAESIYNVRITKEEAVISSILKFRSPPVRITKEEGVKFQGLYIKYFKVAESIYQVWISKEERVKL